VDFSNQPNALGWANLPLTVALWRAVHGPFPPQAVFGPAFTPGKAGQHTFFCTGFARGPFTVLLDVLGFSRIRSRQMQNSTLSISILAKAASIENARERASIAHEK
jgi:hypothetical protein